jgi:DNA-binding GntR family transcriptional regulator
MRFHQAVAALLGSARVDELMRRTLAELRLAFHVMTPKEFHPPYLARNRQIASLILDGHEAAAQREMLTYLTDAETQLLTNYAPADPAGRW